MILVNKTNVKDIKKMIDGLPDDLKNEVFDFVEFIIEKKYKTHAGPKRLSLKWAGGLEEYKNKFTSLELQKKSMDWWSK